MNAYNALNPGPTHCTLDNGVGFSAAAGMTNCQVFARKHDVFALVPSTFAAGHVRSD